MKSEKSLTPICELSLLLTRRGAVSKGRRLLRFYINTSETSVLMGARRTALGVLRKLLL